MENSEDLLKDNSDSQTQLALVNDEDRIQESKESYKNKTKALSLSMNQIAVSTVQIKNEANKLVSITTNLADSKKNLVILEMNTPYRCAAGYENKEVVDKIYGDFHNQMTKIQKGFTEKQDLLYDIKSYCQSVFQYFKSINSSIVIQIGQDLPISEKFLERYNSQKEQIDSKYSKILQQQNSREKNNIIEFRKKVQEHTNEISNLASSEKDLLELHENKKKQEVFKQQAENIKKQIESLDLDLKEYEGKKTIIDDQRKLYQQQKEQEEKDVKIQQNNLKSKADKSEEGNKALVENLSKQIESLTNQIVDVENKQATNKKKLLDDMSTKFDDEMNRLKKLNMGNNKTGRIFILDESGSMQGNLFNSCSKGIKQSLNHLKQHTPNDDFCLIQFDSRARPIVTKQKVTDVDEGMIGSKFNGGGTNYYEAFHMLDQMIPLFDDSDSIVVVFFTDGEDCGNKNDCKKVLKEIKKNVNKTIIFFAIGYGECVKGDGLRSLIEIINGHPMSMQLDSGDRIQTYFEVNGENDILKVFDQITKSNTFSVDQFQKKQELSQQAQNNLIDNFEVVSENCISSLNERINELKEKKKEALENVDTLDLNTIIQDNFSEFHKKLSSHYQTLFDALTLQESEILIKIEEIKSQILQKNVEQKKTETDSKNVEDFIICKSNSQDFLKQGSTLMVQLGFKGTDQYKNFNTTIQSVEELQVQVNELQNKLTLIVEKIHQIYTDLQASIFQILDIQNTTQTEKFYLIVYDKLRDFLNSQNSQSAEEIKALDNYGVIQQFALSCDSSLILDLKKEENEDLNQVVQNLFRNITMERLVKLNQKEAKEGEENVNYLGTYISDMQQSCLPFPEITVDQELIDSQKKKEEEIKDKEQEIRDEKDTETKASLTQDKVSLAKELKEIKQKITSQKTLLKKEAMLKYKEDHKLELNLIKSILTKMYESLQNVKYRITQNGLALPLQEIKRQLKNYENLIPILDQLKIF